MIANLLEISVPYSARCLEVEVKSDRGGAAGSELSLRYYHAKQCLTDLASLPDPREGAFYLRDEADVNSEEKKYPPQADHLSWDLSKDRATLDYLMSTVMQDVGEVDAKQVKLTLGAEAGLKLVVNLQRSRLLCPAEK